MSLCQRVLPPRDLNLERQAQIPKRKSERFPHWGSTPVFITQSKVEDHVHRHLLKTNAKVRVRFSQQLENNFYSGRSLVNTHTEQQRLFRELALPVSS